MSFNCLLILGLSVLCISAHASPLAVGDALPAIAANDQHGNQFTLTTNIQFILVATERACAKAANQKLTEQGAGFLERHGAVYLMDIHSMPSVARWFAFPKMRKYPFRVVLVDSAEALASFPAQTNRVMVLALTPARHIQKIKFWNPAQEPVAGCFQ